MPSWGLYHSVLTPGGYPGVLVTGCENEAKLLEPKKVLQARPWPKKSPTGQNVTQKKTIIKIIIIIIIIIQENSKQFLRPPFFSK